MKKKIKYIVYMLCYFQYFLPMIQSLPDNKELKKTDLYKKIKSLSCFFIYNKVKKNKILEEYMRQNANIPWCQKRSEVAGALLAGALANDDIIKNALRQEDTFFVMFLMKNCLKMFLSFTSKNVMACYVKSENMLKQIVYYYSNIQKTIDSLMDIRVHSDYLRFFICHFGNRTLLKKCPYYWFLTITTYCNSTNGTIKYMTTTDLENHINKLYIISLLGAELFEYQTGILGLGVLNFNYYVVLDISRIINTYKYFYTYCSPQQRAIFEHSAEFPVPRHLMWKCLNSNCFTDIFIKFN